MMMMKSSDTHINIAGPEALSLPQTVLSTNGWPATKQRESGQSVTSEYNLTRSNLHHITTQRWLLISALSAFIRVFSILPSVSFIASLFIIDHHDNTSVF